MIGRISRNEAKEAFAPEIAPILLGVVDGYAAHGGVDRLQMQAIDHAEHLRGLIATADLRRMIDNPEAATGIEIAACIPGRLEAMLYSPSNLVSEGNPMDAIRSSDTKRWRKSNRLFKISSLGGVSLTEQIFRGLGTGGLFHSLLAADVANQVTEITPDAIQENPYIVDDLISSKKFEAVLLLLSSNIHLTSLDSTLRSNTDAPQEPRFEGNEDLTRAQIRSDRSPLTVNAGDYGVLEVVPNIDAINNYWDTKGTTDHAGIKQVGCPARIAVRRDDGSIDSAIRLQSSHQATFLRRSKAFSRHRAFMDQLIKNEAR